MLWVDSKSVPSVTTHDLHFAPSTLTRVEITQDAGLRFCHVVVHVVGVEMPAFRERKKEGMGTAPLFEHAMRVRVRARRSLYASARL